MAIWRFLTAVASAKAVRDWAIYLVIAAALLVCADAPATAAESPTQSPTAFAEATAVKDRQVAQSLDPVAETERHLASVPADQRAKSDAYFEGGYWIDLWSFLLGAAVQWVLLQRGWSAAMRDRAARLTRFRPLQTGAYWTQYLLLTTLLLFPFTAYVGFVREHQYGLATQTFPGWLRDQATALGVGLVLGGLAIVTLYGVLRRMSRTWWLWGSLVFIAFSIVGLLIAPVFIRPLFNTYTPLADPRVRDPILQMARAHGVEVSEVYQVDASRQTTRISANVSGLFGTERITLNDNLLNRGSVGEIKAVMGHELGHYVLNHMYEGLMFTSIVIVVAFGFIRWGFDRAVLRWGATWRVGGVGDVAGLPLFVLLFSIYGYALTPIQNTFVRANESEADLFGLDAAREPDGFATISLKLGDYRKLSPGPIEEWILFDHPSGRTRIHAAMTWKAAQTAGSGADRFAVLRGQMVERQIAARGVRDRRVLDAMRRVPRHLFVPDALRNRAYEDNPLPIGHDQTISQPYIVALMTELVRPQPTDRAFEVGTGSGYQAAVLSQLVQHVYTIELLAPLAKDATERLARLGYRNVTVRAGDGYRGWPEEAPFDIIIVTAAPDEIPQPLVDQLKPGGRLVIPVGPTGDTQELVLVEKDAKGTLSRRNIAPVRFVPMRRGRG